jgi:hypothetical protein
MMKSSRSNPSGNFSFHNTQQPASKPNAPPPARNNNDHRSYNCGQLGHYSNKCTRSRQQNQQNQGQGSKSGNQDKKQNVQQGRLKFTIVVDLPAGAPILLHLRSPYYNIVRFWGYPQLHNSEKISGFLQPRYHKFLPAFIFYFLISGRDFF